MVGTFINVSAILIGGLIGLAFGRKIPKRYQETLLNAMGLFTLAYGVYVFSKTQNVLVPLASIVIGTILGEWWQLEARLERIGSKLQSKFQSGSQPGDDGRNLFIEGFMTASVLYCTGPMAIVGSITDGLSGDFQMLAIKVCVGWIDCSRLCLDENGSAFLSPDGFALSRWDYPGREIAWERV